MIPSRDREIPENIFEVSNRWSVRTIRHSHWRDHQIIIVPLFTLIPWVNPFPSLVHSRTAFSCEVSYFHGETWKKKKKSSVMRVCLVMWRKTIALSWLSFDWALNLETPTWGVLSINLFEKELAPRPRMKDKRLHWMGSRHSTVKDFFVGTRKLKAPTTCALSFLTQLSWSADENRGEMNFLVVLWRLRWWWSIFHSVWKL